MFLLQPDQYQLAAASLKELTINCFFARSVIEHHVNGKVYVDDTMTPNCFYVIHPYGMSLLYGDISDSFLFSSLKDYLTGRSKLRKAEEFLQLFPTELEGRIDAALGGEMSLCHREKTHYSEYTVVKHTRVNFLFNHLKFLEFRKNTTMESHTFLPVDPALYTHTHGSVVPNKFWNNADDFAASGVGFSLIHDNQPAAVAFSSFIHENMLELGMETKPEYRKRGFASIVSAKLIEYCLENGFEPVWSCRHGNQGSYNLALKLGFEPVAYLPYYELLMR